jgi:hypothetical protein
MTWTDSNSTVTRCWYESRRVQMGWCRVWMKRWWDTEV